MSEPLQINQDAFYPVTSRRRTLLNADYFLSRIVLGGSVYARRPP